MTSEWLRNKPFDLFFILGISSIALISGAIVVKQPDLFYTILTIDLWLLGYHHVIATYTRLGLDINSVKEHKLLITALPLAVIISVALLTYSFGIWLITTIYLYWQWYHYTRQSWGVAQFYRRKSDGRVKDNVNISQILFWSIPVWGIVHRSYQAPDSFINLPIAVFPIPESLYLVVTALGIICFIYWVLSKLLEWVRGELPVAHTLYMTSHFGIFYISYIYISDITFGWLVVNIWHNAQYILFVWLYNNNKFKNGVNEQAKVLSTLSQTKNVWLYFLFCLTLTTAVYYTAESLIATTAALMIFYQSVNFHHYIVDSQIWKARKKPIQSIMGIKN